VAIAFVLCSSASALAETRDGLQARGERLGREGKWTDAVHAFKAAEKLEHRAIHACLIALAHARREVWPEAALYLARCHEHPGEPLPEWVPEAEQLIRQHLAELAPITVVVEPADATLTASSFEPDEDFAPGTIYLPRGTHVLVAHAPGRAEQ
jgi:hypothetical protein